MLLYFTPFFLICQAFPRKINTLKPKSPRKPSLVSRSFRWCLILGSLSFTFLRSYTDKFQSVFAFYHTIVRQVNSLDHQSYLLQNVLWKGSSFKIPHQIHDFGHISDLLLTASQQFFRSGEMKRVLTGPVVIVVPRFREADLAGLRSQ